MCDAATAFKLLANIAAVLVLSTTASIGAMPAQQSSRETHRIEGGKVFATQPDGQKRQALTRSQLVGRHGVRDLLDWRDLANKRRFLLTVRETPQQGHVDAEAGNDRGPIGDDLWQVDSDGAERLVNSDIFQAKLSPDGDGLVYVTASLRVAVETESGHVLLDVRGLDPSWRPDGRAIVFSRPSNGSAQDLPRTQHISSIDIETRVVSDLTDGAFDDFRAEFHPSGQWVIFVSAERSSIASFWRVPANGGDTVQLTNIRATGIDDRFVPTPFRRTIWSATGRWFVYDFKAGHDEEVWALEFDTDGELVRSLKVADGVDPQWVVDGVAVRVEAMVDGKSISKVVELPR